MRETQTGTLGHSGEKGATHVNLHINDTPSPLDFLLDFSRTCRAAKEAAGSTPTLLARPMTWM